MSLLMYLAAPYSDPEPIVIQRRANQIDEITAELLRNGFHVFSPITHCHWLAKNYGLPTGWEFWKEYDERMIRACDSVTVLQMEGWQTSVGVSAEVSYATKLGKYVHYYNLQTKIFSPKPD